MFEISSILGLALILLAYYIYNVIYSLYFCPLRKVPGPLIVHFFPIYYKLTILNGTVHQYVLNLHRKYGQIVRTGGDVVSIVSESACKEVHNGYSYSKDVIYEASKIIGETVFNTNNKDYHRFKASYFEKRILAPLFSDKVILDIENIVKKNVNNLVKKINEYSEKKQKFDLGEKLHHFSFDIIGDVGYGKPFNMVKEGHHPVFDYIEDILFLACLVAVFPIVKEMEHPSIKHVYQFSYDAINDAKNHPDRITIINALLKAEDPETGEKLSEKEIAEESILQFIAGADSTSYTLTWFFYNISNRPDIYEKVEREIHNAFPDKESINFTKVKSECHYLNAVIHESMRILPAIAGVLSRVVPKGGRVVDGYFIPEGTSIGASIISKHNSPLLWEDPDRFIPERWLENGEFKNNPDFMAFSMGPRACVGRSLAWMEIYLVTTTLIRNFRFKRETIKEVSSKLFFIVKPSEPIIYTADKF
ncbi:cytochrome P450 [Neoconidiobolus thromboides FSU 785]|nr:cytochrome P450 [Neoconidiobolus thromboides FSU 785]